MRSCIVTGGCGFIGSHLIRHLLASRECDWNVYNYDRLTYAAIAKDDLGTLEHQQNYSFTQGDVCARQGVEGLLEHAEPEVIFHLAAESHVDRSLDGPSQFLKTNIEGTFCVLECALDYWQSMPAGRRDNFRLVHVSTDEVYGELGDTGRFTAHSPYRPRSPYAASKASADHLVRAWGHSYGLPVIVTNCSNNYGPWQHSEKFIPVVICKALREEPIPIYGEGRNVRDWIYVEDHVNALEKAVLRGEPGATYLIGAGDERTNLELAHAICGILDNMRPRDNGRHVELIQFVQDRPGHDFRYAIDPGEAEAALGWRPHVSMEEGLRRTIEWYLQDEARWRAPADQAGQSSRLGLSRFAT